MNCFTLSFAANCHLSLVEQSNCQSVNPHVPFICRLFRSLLMAGGFLSLTYAEDIAIIDLTGPYSAW
jgi:hypothetical protein